MNVEKISVETIQVEGSGSVYADVLVLHMADGSMRLPIEESGGFALPLRVATKDWGTWDVIPKLMYDLTPDE